MSINRILTLAGVAAVVIAAVVWLSVSGRDDTAKPSRDDSLTWFESGPFEVGLAIAPATPRVGENDVIVTVRLADGRPASDAEVEAYAEMAAMGAMPAMRAPADLVGAGDGRFEGAVDLRVRGAWPLTVRIADATNGSAEMTFDLATDRPGLRIDTGGSPLGGAGVRQATAASGDAALDAATIFVDSRRRQLIGLETGIATHHDLVKKLRAVGRVTYDERRVTKVSLKYNAWIGELDANYVGANISRGQRLFTIYSAELLAAQQEFLEARQRLSRRENNDALLTAARQRLRLWDLSDREIAALEERGVPQEYVPIYAPAGGTVVAKNIDSGSSARTGETLLQIADLSRVWVEAELYESELELVLAGMPATVKLSYLPGRSFDGTVDYVYPYLDKISRTGRIRLTLDNDDGALKPDMYAEVTLDADLGHRLAVPEDAVLFAGDSRIVFVDLGDGRLKPVRIRTGLRAQGMIEVTEGLSLGDVIVTSANFLIAAETKLKAGIDQW